MMGHEKFDAGIINTLVHCLLYRQQPGSSASLDLLCAWIHVAVVGGMKLSHRRTDVKGQSMGISRNCPKAMRQFLSRSQPPKASKCRKEPDTYPEEFTGPHIKHFW